jgi:YVTN family beta-propeller protein
MSTANNKVIATIPHLSGDVAVTPDGSKVYVMDSCDVAVIATATNKVSTRIPLGGDLAGIAASPDGSRIYVARPDSGTVSVIATAKNTVIGSPIRVGRNVSSVAVTPDGGKIYVTDTHTDTVLVIATATSAMIGPPIHVGGSPNGVAVTPDGGRIYVTDHDGVAVIAAAANKVISGIPIDTMSAMIGPPIHVGGSPNGVAVTPDGGRIYVTDHDGVAVIAAAANKVISRIPIDTIASSDASFVGSIAIPAR